MLVPVTSPTEGTSVVVAVSFGVFFSLISWKLLKNVKNWPCLRLLFRRNVVRNRDYWPCLILLFCFFRRKVNEPIRNLGPRVDNWYPLTSVTESQRICTRGTAFSTSLPCCATASFDLLCSKHSSTLKVDIGRALGFFFYSFVKKTDF